MPTPNLNIPNNITLFTPPNYRKPKWLTFVQGLCNGLTWRKAIFDAYRNGDTQSVYNSMVSYAADAVVWWNYATYQSLVSSNIGNQPDISPDSWILRCASFIGATERASFNGRYLVLTRALNMQFGTAFKQPPYPAPYDFGTGAGIFSDIYITSDPPSNISFVIYPDDASSTNIYPDTSAPYYLFDPPIYISATNYKELIHFPVAVYNTLGATDIIRLAVIDGFMRKYVMSGCTYEVITY